MYSLWHCDFYLRNLMFHEISLLGGFAVEIVVLKGSLCLLKFYNQNSMSGCRQYNGMKQLGNQNTTRNKRCILKCSTQNMLIALKLNSNSSKQLRMMWTIDKTQTKMIRQDENEKRWINEKKFKEGFQGLSRWSAFKNTGKRKNVEAFYLQSLF